MRFERLLAAAALVLVGSSAGTGCGGEASPAQAVAQVGGLVLYSEAVDHIAARDGLSAEQARARAVDTLRLVAAAREQQVARGQPPGLRPQRAEHLRRSARARLWLKERFEATHRPQDIPDDDPLLVQARLDPRQVHPELYVLCQVVIEPPAAQDDAPPDLEAKAAVTSDPAWREAARAAMTPVLERIERYVPIGDEEACRLISEQVQLSGSPSDPRLSLSFPSPGGFDLDACMQTGDDGECQQRQFAPEWTEQVRPLSPPALSAPFFSRFGLHVVYVAERLPSRPADDPETEAALRQAILVPWRARRLDETLGQMGQQRAVRMVRPTEDEP